jgi:hypothetical protein
MKANSMKIALGVVVALIVAAGIGISIWHEQPSFCNAICHSPMDPYVEGYYSGDRQLLVAAHAEADKECLDCHDSKIDEQIAEATAWVSGDFKDPITPGLEYDDSFCLNGNCHDMSREELAVSTEGLIFNPHFNRHGDIACSTCHGIHAASTLYCAACHEDAMELAEEIGWEYAPAS